MTRNNVVRGALALAAVIAASRHADGAGSNDPPAAAAPPAAVASPAAEVSRGVPKLVDLGRTFCIPCKKMAPILAGLKREYAGRMDVEFIDVGDDPDAARKFGVRLIPTQVFLDASGKELARHEGFMSRGDILGQWKRLGVELQ